VESGYQVDKDTTKEKGCEYPGGLMRSEWSLTGPSWCCQRLSIGLEIQSLGVPAPIKPEGKAAAGPDHTRMRGVDPYYISVHTTVSRTSYILVLSLLVIILSCSDYVYMKRPLARRLPSDDTRVMCWSRTHTQCVVWPFHPPCC